MTEVKLFPFESEKLHQTKVNFMGESAQSSKPTSMPRSVSNSLASHAHTSCRVGEPEVKNSKIREIKESIEKYLTRDFYFSDGLYDLTRSMQT